MKIFGKNPWIATGLVALSLSLAVPARAADSDDDKKKAEKQLKKAEEEQGKKDDEKKEQAQPGLDGEENPLPKIVDLMKKVEERLAETDTGSYTQEEQKKIVEALNLGGKAKSALDDLIKKIEEMQQQMQGQGGGDQQQQKQQQQGQQPKNETPEQKAEREKKEREKQEREKREEEKRKASNPQQKPQQEPKDGQKTKNDKKEKDRRPPDENANLDPRARQQGRWGDLPAKLHGDAEKARNEKVPERFRDEIEKYRQATSD